MNQDIQKDFDVNPDCNGRIGPVSMKLDSQGEFIINGVNLVGGNSGPRRVDFDLGKWSWETAGYGAGFSISAQIDLPACASVPTLSLETGGSGGYGPYAGTGDITLFAGERNPDTKFIDGALFSAEHWGLV